MHDPHATAEAHPDDHAPAFPHGSMRDYVTGFVLSVIMTAIRFFLVMLGLVGSGRLTAFLVLACAVSQIIVHMIYFLHMNLRSEAGWTMISLVFTIVVLVIAVIGTIWVMYHIDANMMLGMATSPPGS